ncbi:MAG: hypothetical protein PUE12_17675 [Oscillospiraceae bacterium]|nr:hypothetical protein [Oscillospiraceae bacterium]
MNNKNTIATKLNISLFITLLIIIAFKTMIINVNASGTWRGYAVYRDGVLFNLNDHAGLMDENTKNNSFPVLQATGPGHNVEWVLWDTFLGNNTYLGIYKPKNFYIEAYQDSFVSKGRELRGISYTIFDQISYNAGSNTWVYPENITDLRCDGVVEYTYEWYSARVGGSDSCWDITRNLSSNKSEHEGMNITPRKQHTNFLSLVTSGEPV